ncbi:MAG: hypothetical protein AAB674_01015 [Patescibacteria group bacterium]
MLNKKEAVPTQEFIDIQSVENDTVLLKNGNLRKILLVSGTNFNLKSEEEQGMIIYSFQGFLNSLDFSVQFFIHSRKLNIENYLEKLGEREIQEENELLKNQIREYREFIKNLVAQNAIMQKQFFIVVPYDIIQLPKAGADLSDKILGLFGKKKSENQENKEFKEQLEQLEQRIDHVINGLHQIGLRAVPLNKEELLELFYNLYNPATTEKKVSGITEK